MAPCTATPVLTRPVLGQFHPTYEDVIGQAGFSLLWRAPWSWHSVVSLASVLVLGAGPSLRASWDPVGLGIQGVSRRPTPGARPSMRVQSGGRDAL